VPKEKLPPDVRDYFVRMGKKGGALGGHARAANMTAEQRSDSARKAVMTRWKKAKEVGYSPSKPGKISKTQASANVQSFAPKAQASLRFRELVAQWRAERGATASITAMAACDAYQKIIGMGPDAIPLIIAQMRSESGEPDQWFWALQVLAGVDPVAYEDRGDSVKMSQSWIAWAEKEGYAG
jgi:hypothetical protein